MFDALQLRAQVDKTMKDIVGLSSRDLHQSDRILRSRYHLTAFDCYEPAVELFDERCFDISQVLLPETVLLLKHLLIQCDTCGWFIKKTS